MRLWWGNLWLRMGALLLIGLAFGGLVSEASFVASPDRTQREARQIELVIPAGTAEKVKAGLPVPSIPASMTFMEGDLLVVRNQDVASHQLGPVWVPPQSSGVLQVGSESNYTYTCSFTQTRLFGLEIQPALTGWIRFQGVLSVGLPTGVMLALYTLAVPGSKKEPREG